MACFLHIVVVVIVVVILVVASGVYPKHQDIVLSGLQWNPSLNNPHLLIVSLSNGSLQLLNVEDAVTTICSSSNFNAVSGESCLVHPPAMFVWNVLPDDVTLTLSSVT